MPTKRDVLSLLPRQDLIDFVENYGIEVPDRRKKEGLIEALAASRKAKLDEMLAMLTREQLKELCRGLGLDDGGVEKAAIIERIAGTSRAPASEPRPPSRSTASEPRSGTASSRTQPQTHPAPPPSAGGKPLAAAAGGAPNRSAARAADTVTVPAAPRPATNKPHPAVPTLELAVLDRILALQFLVAWAGEGRSEPKRFGWWDTDLVDPDGGGDLLARLLPRTAAWASLDLVREAARSVDAAARAKHGVPDRLRSIFFVGFDVDERLADRLRALKREGRRPEEALPLPFALGAAFDPVQVSAALASAGATKYENVPPVGRLVKGSPPAGPDDLVQKLAAALVPPADHYPLPFFMLEG